MTKKIHEHFKMHDPILYEYIQRIELEPLELPSNVFERLCRAIIGQQLSVKAAATIYQRLLALNNSDSLTPDNILKFTEQELRRCGISYAKIRALKDLAAKVSDGTVDLEALNHLTDEQVIETLCGVRGIGRWTAEMFLLFSLGREDIYSYGDAGLMRALQTIYQLGSTPTREEIDKIIHKWSPYKSFASRILWRSLDNEPIKK